MPDHERGMRLAIAEAEVALRENDRPFGCVILNGDGKVIGVGAGSETPTDPTRHSEILAIQRACRVRGGPLWGCTLYSTHEPCAMCCGAIAHSKIGTVVFGSYRHDLPGLFRSRQFTFRDLLTDTSVPPLIVPGILRHSCIGLFRRDPASAHLCDRCQLHPEDCICVLREAA